MHMRTRIAVMARKKKKQIPAYQTKYYDIKNPSSYVSKTRLMTALPPDKRSEAESWLQKQPAYLMYKRAPKKINRLKVVAGFQQQIQADLVDVSNLSKYNSNVKYLLTAIDPFSKKAFVEPLLKKDAVSVTNAFREILDRLGFKPIIFSVIKEKNS